jgi:hypothetical protein
LLSAQIGAIPSRGVGLVFSKELRRECTGATDRLSRVDVTRSGAIRSYGTLGLLRGTGGRTGQRAPVREYHQLFDSHSSYAGRGNAKLRVHGEDRSRPAFLCRTVAGFRGISPRPEHRRNSARLPAAQESHRLLKVPFWPKARKVRGTWLSTSWALRTQKRRV